MQTAYNGKLFYAYLELDSSESPLELTLLSTEIVPVLYLIIINKKVGILHVFSSISHFCSLFISVIIYILASYINHIVIQIPWGKSLSKKKYFCSNITYYVLTYLNQ